MKYCQNCGAELFEQALMCPKCKTVFNADSSLVNSIDVTSNVNNSQSENVLPYKVRNFSCFNGEFEDSYSFFAFIKFSFSTAKLMEGTDLILEEKEIKFRNRSLNYADIRECYVKKTDIPFIYGYGKPWISIVIKSDQETISFATYNLAYSEIVSREISNITKKSVEKVVNIINSKIQGD